MRSTRAAGVTSRNRGSSSQGAGFTCVRASAMPRFGITSTGNPRGMPPKADPMVATPDQWKLAWSTVATTIATSASPDDTPAPPTPKAGKAKAAPVADAPLPEGVKEFTYKRTPQGELKLQVHYPADWKATDQRPAIVFFFGGGWKGGTTTQFLNQATYLAKRGLVAVRADYRVESRQHTTPESAVEDAKSAVRWVRAHAVELGVDPQRIVSSGGSAGGHLAACTGMTDAFEAKDEDAKISSRPSAMVLFNPALDLAALDVAAKWPEGKGDGKAIVPQLDRKSVV